MTNYTVTATQTSNQANGMAITVLVFTGAEAVGSQPGATASTNAPTNFNLNLTPTQLGSYIVGAMSNGASGVTLTPEANTTQLENFSDTVQNNSYITYRATSTTNSLTSQTYGFTNTAMQQGAAIVQAEILSSGSIAIDGSSPASIGTNSAQSIQTASFAPPAGSLLVALVSSDGSSSSFTMSVSSTPTLTWSTLVFSTGTGGSGDGIYAAQIPGSPITTPAQLNAMLPNHVLYQVFQSGAGGRNHSF